MFLRDQCSRFIAAILSSLVVISVWSCATHKQYQVKDIVAQERDDLDIPEPEERVISVFEDGFQNSLGRELTEYGNLSWHNRKLINNHKQAKNVNALDEVPNSTWFTNRHAQKPMSIAALERGTNRGAGPDRSGPFTITGAKVEGVSPGMTIKDVRGDTYFVKFDIAGYPQLNTAAEVISTKFVYACGYNTPENYLSAVDPMQLQIADGVTVKNKWGRKVPMTQAFVDELFTKVNESPDGTYRIVASKRLAGRPLGPFNYVGRRKDDPNDHIPHKHRRELRGYKVIAAWLNNNDAKASNSLDMYVEQDGKRFVRHFLIDFATSLGSGGLGSAGSNRGHAGVFDLGHMLKKIVSLGLWVEPWEREAGTIVSPSVGYFDSKLFNPGDYAQIVPNPAFQKATELDGFWGAKLVMAFTDEEIRAVVRTGEFENQEDADYIAKILIERRDKTGRYWYGKVNPLDHFRFSTSSNSRLAIEFDDLAVKGGFEDKTKTVYRYKLRYQGKNLSGYARSEQSATLVQNAEMYQAAQDILHKRTAVGADDKIFAFRVETSRDGGASFGKHLDVYFYQPMEGSTPPQIIAIEREN